MNTDKALPWYGCELQTVEIFGRSDDFPIGGCSCAGAHIAPAEPSASSATSAPSRFAFDLGFSQRLRVSAVNIILVATCRPVFIRGQFLLQGNAELDARAASGARLDRHIGIEPTRPAFQTGGTQAQHLQFLQ